MHQKDLNIAVLLDFYGDLLSQKPKTFLECYYNDDMSLAEIADIYGISRQGVLSVIKKSREELIAFESKLSLSQKYKDGKIEAKEMIKHITELAALISPDDQAKAKQHIDALMTCFESHS
ncbi:MAG: DNA-binding protein [Clostridia bacterium]|nr:DNA-binding protein [Clostridia bacterium]